MRFCACSFPAGAFRAGFRFRARVALQPAPPARYFAPYTGRACFRLFAAVPMALLPKFREIVTAFHSFSGLPTASK